MRAAILPGDSSIAVVNRPTPGPGDGEVLVQVLATGVCGCSRERPGYRGLEPHDPDVVAGHEASGVVVELGDGIRGLRVGDRVVVHAYAGCEHCEQCLAGWPQHCAGTRWGGRDRDGGWAELQVATEAMCIRLPDAVSFEDGTTAACTAGTAHQVLTSVRPEPGSTVMVYGVGSIGLSAVLLARALGFRTIALEDNEPRRALARAIGADQVLDNSTGDVVERVLDLTDGRGVDLAIDPTGTAGSKTDCIRSTRLRGDYVVIGEHSGTTELPTQELIRRGIRMTGSWSVGRRTVDGLLRLVAARDLTFAPLVTHRFDLTDIDSAYRSYETKTTGKVVVLPAR